MTIFTARKQSLGQGNIFTPVCHSVHGGHAWLLWGACMVALGGVHGCSRGACMVAPGGACVVCWGACVVALGGHVWLLRVGGWGVGGHVGFIWGGLAWFYLGGMCGFIQGGHVWFYLGGVHGFFSIFQIQWDTVNELAVRILLECILVL